MLEKRIRIAYDDEYPLVNPNCSRVPTLHVTKGCSSPGMVVEIFTLLTNYLNLTIDVQARSFNGNFSQTFVAILNNETDLTTAIVTNTSLRAERFDFTDELYLAYPIIAIKRTDHSFKNLLSFFNVYHLDAWISMLGVFILFTSFALTVRYIECRLNLRKSGNFGEILWKMVRVQLVQAEAINYKLIAGQSSLLVFCVFQICIIIGLFQGFILTSVVRKTHVAPFSSDDDIVKIIKDRKLTYVAVSKDDWFLQQIKSSIESPFYELREVFQHSSYKLVGNDEALLQEVDKGNGAFTFMQEDYIPRFKAQEYCDITFIEVNSIAPTRARFMFRKNSPFLPLFNEAIFDNKAKIEVIKRKYLVHTPPSKCAAETIGPVALTMTPFFGLFIFFFAGIFLAFLAFSGEVLKWRIFGKLARKNPPKITTNLASNGAKICQLCKEQKTEDAKPLLKTIDGEVAQIVLNFLGLPADSEVFVKMRKK